RLHRRFRRRAVRRRRRLAEGPHRRFGRRARPRGEGRRLQVGAGLGQRQHRRLMRAWAVAFAALAAACNGAGAQGGPEGDWAPLWTLSGLAEPESVAASPDGRTLYVANVGGEGDVRDGNGFISRVSPSGKLIQREWVRGLDAPKGAVVSGGKLYVSD